MNAGGIMAPSGALKMTVNRARKAPLSWRIRNGLRPAFWGGWLAVQAAWLFTKITGLPVMYGELALRLRKANGVWIDYGVVGYRVVTDVGVAFIVDAWQNTTELEDMKFHGVGTGTNAEAAGDTALQTESTTILNPNSTRGTGTQSEPSANILRSTATNAFDGSGAITEHGVFNSSTTGAGTLFDRTVFSAINVANGDSLTSQYSLTLTSGS